MQLDACDLQIPPSVETPELEREERGWWSLRFHQVLREFQRQNPGCDTVNAAHA